MLQETAPGAGHQPFKLDPIKWGRGFDSPLEYHLIIEWVVI